MYHEYCSHAPRASLPPSGVRLGAAATGAVCTLAAQLVLALVGAAVSATLNDGSEGSLGLLAGGLCSAMSSLVAGVTGLLIGGFVAGRCARESTGSRGLAEGALAWALALLGSVAITARGSAVLAPGTTPLLDPTFSLEEPSVNAVTGGMHASAVASLQCSAPLLWTLVVTLALGAIAALVGAVAGAERDATPVRRPVLRGAPYRSFER